MTMLIHGPGTTALMIVEYVWLTVEIMNDYQFE
jgi:hypothetical protein